MTFKVYDSLLLPRPINSRTHFHLLSLVLLRLCPQRRQLSGFCSRSSELVGMNKKIETERVKPTTRHRKWALVCSCYFWWLEKTGLQTLYRWQEEWLKTLGAIDSDIRWFFFILQSSMSEDMESCTSCLCACQHMLLPIPLIVFSICKSMRASLQMSLHIYTHQQTQTI